MDGGYNLCQSVESGGQDTYYALAIFSLLDVPAPKIETTVKWLQSFPADNIYGCFYIIERLILCGSFRRSVELGISTFEDTYHALSILKRVS